jgi:uncharacterized protein
MTFFKLTLFAVAAIYVAAALGMYLMQRQFQYFPTHVAPTPEMVGLDGTQTVSLKTPDGETLDLWYAKAEAGKHTILFFHGNAGEIGDRAARFSFYQSQGFGVAFLSYRGFGGSSGTISETGLIMDALTAYDWLLSQSVPPESIALVGESLGTGVAVQLAAQRPVATIVLEAPYSAAVDVAADIYPWLPVRLLMKDQFRSTDHIQSVTAPIYILHGTMDTVIPLASGRALFAATTAPTRFEELPGAGHEALFDPQTWAKEADFLKSLLPR